MSWSPRKVFSVTGVASLPARISEPAISKMRRWISSTKCSLLQEIGDAVERVVVDEDRAEQRLLGLEIVRRRAIGRLCRDWERRSAVPRIVRRSPCLCLSSEKKECRRTTRPDRRLAFPARPPTGDSFSHLQGARESLQPRKNIGGIVGQPRPPLLRLRSMVRAVRRISRSKGSPPRSARAMRRRAAPSAITELAPTSRGASDAHPYVLGCSNHIDGQLLEQVDAAGPP